MKRASLLCLLLAALVATAVGADVQVKTWFPDSPSFDFAPGKLATAVIGIKNTGSSAVNITAAVGGLALVSNPAGSIFNFTSIGFNEPELGPGEENVVEYGMYMPSNLPPRDFYLRVQLMFTENSQFIHKLVFNETISVTEPNKLVDTELLGLYGILLGLLAAAVYGGRNVAQSQGWMKKTKKTKVATAAAPSANDKAEWLKGTIADKSKKVAKQS